MKVNEFNINGLTKRDIPLIKANNNKIKEYFSLCLQKV